MIVKDAGLLLGRVILVLVLVDTSDRTGGTAVAPIDKTRTYI